MIHNDNINIQLIYTLKDNVIDTYNTSRVSCTLL